MTCLCTSWMKEVLFIEMGKSKEGTGLGVGGFGRISSNSRHV